MTEFDPAKSAEYPGDSLNFKVFNLFVRKIIEG